uniref:Uncharacterized protein n=1 Tax=Cacopsylla melanoneura TaxID=428564 RepID=A0A8D9BE71_9HEMI
MVHDGKNLRVRCDRVSMTFPLYQEFMGLLQSGVNECFSLLEFMSSLRSRVCQCFLFLEFMGSMRSRVKECFFNSLWARCTRVFLCCSLWTRCVCVRVFSFVKNYGLAALASS